MQTIPTINLETLVRDSGFPCVSLYLPTGAGSHNPDEGRIRLKNMVRTVMERTEAMGLRQSDLPQGVAQLQDLANNREFFGRNGRGLAIFLSSNTFQHFALPEEFKDTLVVSDRFHIKPLVPLVHDNPVLLLRLAQKQPRLYQVSRHRITEVPVPDMPVDLPTALNEHDLNGSHSNRLTPQPTGGLNMVHQGTGSGSGVRKEKIARYCRIIDQAIRPILQETQMPLMIQGVDFEAAIFRDNSQYNRIMEGVVHGNAENMTEDQLQGAAMEALKPYHAEIMRRELERYRNEHAHGRASTHLGEICRAAAVGRVDTMFVGVGVQCWGRYNAERMEAECRCEPQPRDYDLLDFAAAETLMRHGVVFALKPGEVPADSPDCPIAAIFRY